ncbi:hypothetical protein MMC06_001875 [Schaereria dolodes]|nr:hypothetical protein [Schaereria dolodes]
MDNSSDTPPSRLYPALAIANESLRVWGKVALQILGVATVAVVVLPYLVCCVRRCVIKWDIWQLHQGTNAERNDYGRTWHGWAEGGEHTRQRQSRKNPRNFISSIFAWKSPTADYSWVFWDPDGTRKQNFASKRNVPVVRLLNEWMRSYKHGSFQPFSRMTPDSLDMAERGMIKLQPLNHASEDTPTQIFLPSHRGTILAERSARPDGTSASLIQRSTSTAIIGALPDQADGESVGTLRKRSGTQGRSPIWLDGSTETKRATYYQLLMPKNNVPRTYLSNSIPESHHEDMETDDPQTQEKALSTPLLLSQHADDGNELYATRSKLLPLLKAFGSYPDRPLDRLLGLASSDEASVSSRASNEYSSDPALERDVRRKSVGLESSYEKDCVVRLDLDNRLDLWTHPELSDAPTSIAGTDRRNATDVNDYHFGQTIPYVSSEEPSNLEDYEAEGSLDGAILIGSGSSDSARLYLSCAQALETSSARPPSSQRRN